MANKWELWGSISLFCVAVGIWLLTFQDIAFIFPFIFLFGGMIFFLICLAALIGQDPDRINEAPDAKIPPEELADALVDMFELLKHWPGKIVFRDVTMLMKRRGHRIVASQQALRVLLQANHLALRSGFLYYFDNKDECSDFKLQTKLNGLKSSLNNP